MDSVYKDSIERKYNEMSFVGLFKSKEGIVAFADSKGSWKDSYGNLYEEQNRVTQKVFTAQDFLFVTFGANLYIQDNEQHYLENLLNEKIKNYQGTAKEFFELIYRALSETFTFWTTETYHFIYGEKVDRNFYLYSIIISKQGIVYEKILKTASQIYNTIPMSPNSLSIDPSSSIEEMKNSAMILVTSVIQLGDTFLKYNPVGGDVYMASIDVNGHVNTYINGVKKSFDF